MQIYYPQNFEALTLGALNGQDNWVETGGSNYTVQGTIVYTGNKAISIAVDAMQLDRPITASTRGIYTIAVRKTSISANQFDIYLMGSNAGRELVQFRTDGNIWLYSGSRNIQAYSANTWYLIELEYNTITNQDRIRINGGAWSAWGAMVNTGPIDALRFYNATGGSTCYFDDIRVWKDSWFGNTAKGRIGRFFNGDPSLIGYWQLNGSSVDNSGIGNNGVDTAMSYLPIRDCKNKSLQKGAFFNGSTSVITVGNNLNFERTDSFSIAFWIKTSTTANNAIMAKWSATDRGWRIEVNGSAANSITLTLTNVFSTNDIEVYLANANINDNTWHLIVFTYNGSSLASGVKIYKDGVPQNLTVATNNLSATILNTDEAKFGARNPTPVLFYSGYLDEIGVWNRVLSAQEISQYYRWATSGKNKSVLSTFFQVITSLLTDSLMNASSRFASISRLGTFGRTTIDNLMNSTSRFVVITAVRNFSRLLSNSIMYAANRLTTFIANFPIWFSSNKNTANWTTSNKNTANWTTSNKSNIGGEQTSSSTPN